MVRLMRPNTPRPGLTLIEMVVSLMLMLVLLSVASLIARRSIQTVSTVSTGEVRGSALSDGLRTLSRHVSTAEPLANDVRMARDSVLDLVHTIGVATICTVDRDTVVLSAANDTLPWSTMLPRNVTTDDGLRIWSDADQRWIDRSVSIVGAAAGGCGDSTTSWPGRAGQRLIMDDSIAGLRPGAVVRVLQRERWSLVRGGDGQWSLSLATWDAGSRSFATPQPLVTPLAAPTAPSGPGLTIRAVDAAGRPFADSALSSTRSIAVRLNGAIHPRAGSLTDSVRINVGAH
jgi:prepilin-type N-terminal cleavage/methylation domain-containing protein